MIKFKQKLFHSFRILISYLFTKLIYKIYYINVKVFTKKYKIEELYKLDNSKIKIFSDYRYKVKAGWRFFNSLESLSFLNNKKLLNKIEINFFINSISKRTLSRPLKEINFFAQKICKKYKNFFYEESLEDEPKLKKSIIENHSILKYFISQNLKQINFLNSKINKKINVGAKILEVGYISGGHSIIAFEKLGFNSFGIDNFYDGKFEDKNFPFYDVKNQLKSNAIFLKGDISKRNISYENKFDLIYSTSVLEHLINIDNSLLEMNNLLKNDGIIFHNYNPYFCVNGGHALAIGDSPFMHLQLDHGNYISYIKKNRPFESNIATDWINNHMNKEISQEIMKNKITAAGFETIYFESFNFHKYNLDFNKEIYFNIKKNYNFLTMNDLLGTSVTFIAKKK